MSALFDYLNKTANPDLLFIDADTKESIRWNKLIVPFPFIEDAEKKLVFLYLDNSLVSVKILLSFVKSKHLLCLLGNGLQEDLKKQLESIYLPDYIFDNARNAIPGSTIVYEQNTFKLFYTKKSVRPLHEDLKILLSTSGTTGSPKFVKLSDSNFINNTESIIDYLPIDHFDNTILNLPIHYSYGLSVLLTNIVRGGKIICSNDTVLSRSFWNVFKEYAINNLAGVPYTYEMLIRLGFLKMTDLQLKYMTQAGGKLEEQTLLLFAEYTRQQGAQFYVMYGQTEATARMSYLPPDKLSDKTTSIGLPIKNGKFSIDPSNKELMYTGPNVGSGYAQSVEDLEHCSPLAKLHTGDLAEVDIDGFYYITGRLKRFIKLFGNRISLDEIEQYLTKEYNGFIGCCGIQDKTLLIFSDKAEVMSDQVRNYVSDKYKTHISAIKYVYLAVIPLTQNHKVNYQAVIRTYGG